MDWKLYLRMLGFDRSGLAFAADVDYQINNSSTKVFVGLYDNLTARTEQDQNYIAQIGHVWQYGPRSIDWGANYFLFGNAGELTGMVNGNLTVTGRIIDVSKTDANRLIKASWDLASLHETLAPSLEKCIISLERAKRKKS